MLELNKIYNYNSVDFMKAYFPDSFVDLTITSPPYDNLRKYNGYEFEFDKMASELYRITKKGGVVVWVVGDSTVKGSETGTSFKQALHFKEIGFNLHDTMIYSKYNWLPLTHNRYEQQFEYMFVLSKGKPKTFNPIEIPSIHKGKLPNATFRQDASGKLEKAHTKNVVKENKRKGNVWEYHVGFMKSTKDKIAYKHPAVFPEQLAHDHIISWSNEGDIVFDPMCGSGTVCKMSYLNKRTYIGIDISKEYVDIANERIQSTV